jgi:hypothetical protein
MGHHNIRQLYTKHQDAFLISNKLKHPTLLKHGVGGPKDMMR